MNRKIFTCSDESNAICGFPPGYNPTLSEVGKLIHPEDLSSAQSSLLHLFKTGEPYNIDFRIIKNDTNELKS